MPFLHVTFPTRRFEETVEFFARILEFPRIASPDNINCRAAWFAVDHHEQVHILEIPGAGPPANEGEFGKHVAFEFPHARWLRIKNQLEDANFPIIPPERSSNVSRFFVHDPNGYCLEFVQSPSA